ncbi:hypothetical protein Nit79A3_0277 [Nitrosomonas sp. Is79A3]|uniref:hypothetical protein n=1 Tax=Nitrosomonas sp. (strain Is79A3) TaxID=261292 RepID=UPI000215D269
MKAKNIALMIVTTSSLGILTGCATIMGQSAAETLNVRSAPDQANVVITDEAGVKVFEGKTPTSLPLEKKKSFFSGKKYFVNIKKEGHVEQTVIVDTEVNGWYVGGNLVFGGLLGYLIIDPATGAMWKLDKQEISVTLNASAKNTSHNNKSIDGGLTVMSIEQVPAHLREKMQPIN